MSPQNFKSANLPAMEKKLRELDAEDQVGHTRSIFEVLWLNEEVRTQRGRSPKANGKYSRRRLRHFKQPLPVMPPRRFVKLHGWTQSYSSSHAGRQRRYSPVSDPLGRSSYCFRHVLTVLDLIRTIFAYSPSVLKTNDIRAATFARLLSAAELNQAWPAEGEQIPKHRHTNIILFIRCMANALQLSAQGFETGAGSWTNQVRE